MNPVPVMRPKAPSVHAALARLEQVDGARWYSNLGPQEVELRQRFGERLGVAGDRIATVANATLGIMGAISVLGGRRWAVPSFTFPATPAAVLGAGAELVLEDIDASTWALVPGTGTDGSVPVAPFGAAPRLEEWSGHDRVVHDAAASLGEELDLSTLPVGHAVVFSVHATKVLGAGEGGIVVFGDAGAADRFRSWTNFGFAGTRESRTVGLNAKMSEVQSVYVHAALDGWEEERREWSSARAALVALADRVGIELLPASRDGINPYAIAVFADGAMAERVARELESAHIETRRWWSRGCHRMPAFEGLTGQAFPVTDRVAASSLGLPFFRDLGDEHLERLERALRRALGGDVARR